MAPASHPGLYVMNADGSNIKLLLEGWKQVPGGTQSFFAGQPTWSGDSKKIAFTSDAAGLYQVFTMNADGTGVHQNTPQGTEDQFPAWSY